MFNGIVNGLHGAFPNREFLPCQAKMVPALNTFCTRRPISAVFFSTTI